jgi:hypothetical protein
VIQTNNNNLQIITRNATMNLTELKAAVAAEAAEAAEADLTLADSDKAVKAVFAINNPSSSRR